MRNQISAQRARELLDYDAQSGRLTWRAKPNNRIVIGTGAGRVGRNGYIVVRLDGLNYHAHRIVWLMVHGIWPNDEIDHINGQRSDNRLSNLRDVDHARNLQNRRCADRDSASGVLGASPRGKRFLAQRRINGKHLYLGMFATAAEAHAAYVAANSTPDQP